MPIESIHIENFISLSREWPVFDVRSPSEYLHAHIPGAFSLPIFSDEQRKVIGTAYKKESREKAVHYGLNYFSERMKSVLEEVKNILEKDSPFSEQKILLHCWRGGMRSQTMAWLLSLYGYQVFLLDGGYKSYRNWTLAQFEKKYPLKILGGYTGSGKTETLLEMKRQGLSVIDLEGIAHHKGSAFGSLGQGAQPSQEMFENILEKDSPFSE
ncbi:MAG: tRNA 2-selenouridine(34) synthase MnmH, partial [Ginsengibacter sp.]